jgi:hypothetical protein
MSKFKDLRELNLKWEKLITQIHKSVQLSELTLLINKSVLDQQLIAFLKKYPLNNVYVRSRFKECEVNLSLLFQTNINFFNEFLQLLTTAKQQLYKYNENPTSNGVASLLSINKEIENKIIIFDRLNLHMNELKSFVDTFGITINIPECLKNIEVKLSLHEEDILFNQSTIEVDNNKDEPPSSENDEVGSVSMIDFEEEKFWSKSNHNIGSTSNDRIEEHINQLVLRMESEWISSKQSTDIILDTLNAIEDAVKSPKNLNKDAYTLTNFNTLKESIAESVEDMKNKDKIIESLFTGLKDDITKLQKSNKNDVEDVLRPLIDNMTKNINKSLNSSGSNQTALFDLKKNMDSLNAITTDSGVILDGFIKMNSTINELINKNQQTAKNADVIFDKFFNELNKRYVAFSENLEDTVTTESQKTTDNVKTLLLEVERNIKSIFQSSERFIEELKSQNKIDVQDQLSKIVTEEFGKINSNVKENIEKISTDMKAEINLAKSSFIEDSKIRLTTNVQEQLSNIVTKELAKISSDVKQNVEKISTDMKAEINLAKSSFNAKLKQSNAQKTTTDRVLKEIKKLSVKVKEDLAQISTQMKMSNSNATRSKISTTKLSKKRRIEE